MRQFDARRRLLLGGLASVPAMLAIAHSAGARSIRDLNRSISNPALGDIEKQHGGRLGVAVLYTANGHRFGWRASERFAMCSTFKVLAAALVLKRVDQGKESLDRRILYGRDDLVTYSPVTEKHTGGDGMTLAQLCHAAITLSDNTAGNLLLASFGGPAGLTAFVRTLGDPVTRLDRNEPTLNEATPDDPRDTTTPDAMAGNLRTLLLGHALSATSRTQLGDWMLATSTGDMRLRAGLPATWRVGDKTGTSGSRMANDIAIAWPPDRAPIIITAYYDAPAADPEQRNCVIADVARVVSEQLNPASRADSG